MDKEVRIQLPKLGESILSATVVQWLKKVGDTVQLDEALLEVSTDKVNSEIPSPVAGILKEILVKQDEAVEVGHDLAVITAKDISSQVTLPSQAFAPSLKEEEAMDDYYSPAVLQLAKKEGIAFDELESIKGTGSGGRITRKDVERYLEGRRTAVEPPVSSDQTVSRVKMTGLRKAIAENMVRSYNEIPHASLINEVDVTDLVQFIKEEKEAFFQTHGVKLTITSFIAKAIALATVQYPLLNASVDGENIVVKHSVNVGVAVGVEHGVIVPVIKLCERKNVVHIAKEVAGLAERTHGNKLQPDDVRDGTITLTNFGMTGTRAGFPIIRYPEVAIIGVGAIQKRVVVTSEETIAIRQMMDLTLCFDHRVIDGLYGCGFINAIKGHLQQPKQLYTAT